MKILCALSSIEFTCEHFPGSFTSREIAHPIFELPQKKLLAYAGKWASSELTTTDSYLLFLALLNTSELIEWRVPAMRSVETDSIVANNMEHLLRTVIKINTIHNYEEVFPHYAISQDTRFLSNVRFWIQNWHDCYNDFRAGYKSAHESAIINRRESALARLIKNPHKPISSYASQLADWAAVAGSFPTFSITSPFGSSYGTKMSCAEFWKEIIIRCTKNEFIFSIPSTDLDELISHCEDNIPIGSIYSHALFKCLRIAQKRMGTFLDLGDPDLKSSYTLLESRKTAEDANMIALINSAPTEKPIREQYPSDFMYMKAKLRWDMSQKFKKDDGV